MLSQLECDPGEPDGRISSLTMLSAQQVENAGFFQRVTEEPGAAVISVCGGEATASARTLRTG